MIEPRGTVINVAEVCFHDAPGGAARLAIDLCARQIEWGYRAFLVCKKVSPNLADREERDGVQVVRIPVPGHPPPSLLNLYAHIRNAKIAVRQILHRVRDVDVIHVHSQIQGVGAMRAASGRQIRKICSVHSPLVHEQRTNRRWDSRRLVGRLASKLSFFAARRVESICYRAADVVTCDSDFSAGLLNREYSSIFRGRRPDVFPGWVDSNRFRPDGPTTSWTAELQRLPRRPVFFTVRALVPRNGLEGLIQAASSLRRKGLGFDLVIVGDGPLRSNLLAQIRELSLTNHVTLLGWVEDEYLPVLYRSCDAFVLPTLSLECFGIIILEALASGVPVIATPVGAIPELLNPVYPEGLLSDSSPATLAEAMLRIAEQRISCRREENLSERFQSYVRGHYSTEIGMDRFRQIYDAE